MLWLSRTKKDIYYIMKNQVCSIGLVPSSKENQISSSLYMCVCPRNCPCMYKHTYIYKCILYRNERIYIFFYILLFSLTVWIILYQQIQIYFILPISSLQSSVTVPWMDPSQLIDLFSSLWALIMCLLIS